MLSIEFSPKWFNGVDCIFEGIGLVVTLLIAFYGLKLFKFSKDERYKYFSWSFLSMSVALLFKILTNFTFYQQVLERHTHGLYIITFNVVHSVTPFYVAGVTAYHILMLAGLAGLYHVMDKRSDLKQTLITLFMVIVIALFSAQSYFVFHLTSSVFIAAIAYNLYRNYTQNRSGKALFTIAAFSVLLLSQIAFIFVVLNSYTYVVAEVIQLAGFVLLLYNYCLLTKK